MVVIPEHFICSLVFRCNFALFAVKRISLSPWRFWPSFLRVWSSFWKFFSIMAFAAETSPKCNSATYNFCSFRPKRAFPRPWAARWIKEKLLLISFCTFVFMFCCFQKVCCSAKSDRNPIWVVFFRRVFTCHGKFSARLIPNLYRPQFATSHNITQNYILSKWISSETEFFGGECWFLRCDMHRWYFQCM